MVCNNHDVHKDLARLVWLSVKAVSRSEYRRWRCLSYYGNSMYGAEPYDYDLVHKSSSRPGCFNRRSVYYPLHTVNLLHVSILTRTSQEQPTGFSELGMAKRRSRRSWIIGLRVVKMVAQARLRPRIILEMQGAKNAGSMRTHSAINRLLCKYSYVAFVNSVLEAAQDQ